MCHGMTTRYDSEKSELLVFKAGKKSPKSVKTVCLFSPVRIGGAILSRKNKFKYLEHWVSLALSEDLDV